MYQRDNYTNKRMILGYIRKGQEWHSWCLLDAIISSPAQHCQKCKLYHGSLTMTCERWHYKCLK